MLANSYFASAVGKGVITILAQETLQDFGDVLFHLLMLLVAIDSPQHFSTFCGDKCNCKANISHVDDSFSSHYFLAVHFSSVVVYRFPCLIGVSSDV